MIDTEQMILLFGVLVSIVTFFAQNMEARSQESVRRRLDHINVQLEELYGPLRGRLSAGHTAMSSLRLAIKQKRLLPRQHLYDDEGCKNEKKNFRWFEYEVPQLSLIHI